MGRRGTSGSLTPFVRNTETLTRCTPHEQSGMIHADTKHTTQDPITHMIQNLDHTSIDDREQHYSCFLHLISDEAQAHAQMTTLYPYTADLTALDSCKPQRPPHLPLSCHNIVTPLNEKVWAQELIPHPDQVFTQYTLQGIKHGFRIGFQYESHDCYPVSKNMQSAGQNPGPVEDYLRCELEAGRVIGPFAPWEVPGVQISRFGVIPKSNQAGSWRLILDLSFPNYHSVNDGIDPTLCSLQYATIDQAVAKIIELGPNTHLAKVDIEKAYRIIPIHPQDRALLGMSWKQGIYVDSNLPFGLRSAPKIFSAVADALEWILGKKGVSELLHYLDDYLTMGPLDQCKANLELILSTCKALGVPLKTEKIEGPSTRLIFLGILLDTTTLEIRLPEEKLAELCRLIQEWKQRQACRKRELLSLIGKLGHACKVVVAGRIFLRRMIETACKAHEPNHWVRLNRSFHSDLAWWESFLEVWNGRSMMEIHMPAWDPEIDFYSDVSGSWGCGAVWQEKWLQCPWAGWWLEECIATKELLPIVLACAMWGPHWEHRRVQVHCDNSAVVQIIHKHSSKDHTILHLLRCLHFFCAAFDINLKARHIPGVNNTSADAISRGLMQVFHRVNPGAQSQPTPVPAELWCLLVESNLDWLSPTWKLLLQDSLRTAWQRVQDEPTTQPKGSISGSATSLV